MRTGRARPSPRSTVKAGTGGVLLSLHGQSGTVPYLRDKIPHQRLPCHQSSIDQLREPMETRTFLGKKPGKIERDADGNLVPNLSPPARAARAGHVLGHELRLDFLQRARVARRARPARSAPTITPARAACIRTSINTARTPSCRVASGRFGVHKDYLEAGAAIEIKNGPRRKARYRRPPARPRSVRISRAPA